MPASGWSRDLVIEDLLGEGESFLWTDLSKGVGSRAFDRGDDRFANWVWGLGFFVLLISVSLLLVVFAHLAWLVLTALIVWSGGEIIRQNLKQKPNGLKSDIDYGLTPTRLICLDRSNGDATIVYRRSIGSLCRDGSTLTVFGREDDPVLVLRGLSDAETALKLINKTLGPAP